LSTDGVAVLPQAKLGWQKGQQRVNGRVPFRLKAGEFPYGTYLAFASQMWLGAQASRRPKAVAARKIALNCFQISMFLFENSISQDVCAFSGKYNDESSRIQ